MRTVAAGESATISSRVSTSWIRVQVEDSTGAMVDRTSFVKGIEYEQPKADGPIAQATFTFSRQDGTGSTLAPLMTSNPPLEEGRTIALAIDAGAGVWKEQYRGRIEDLDWSGRWQNEVVAECSDQSGELRDTFIEKERAYGSDAGVAMETVMQSLYTDNAATPPTLHVPVATSAVVTPAFTQPQTGLYEAARALSDAIGWVHWWRNFDASTSDWKLTLFEPARTSTTSQRTFGTSDYYDVSEMNTSLADIRNVVGVTYVDADGVERSITPVKDDASIAKYGRRYMAIIEGEDSPIRTAADATKLANAALSDLKEPTATLEIVAPYFWPGEIGVDRYTFTANGIHFSSNQTLAATNIRHSLVVGQRPETRIQTRGQPTGGVNIWKAKSQRPKPGSRPETVLVTEPQWRDSADGLSEIGEWTNGAKIEEIWIAERTVEGQVTAADWTALRESEESKGLITSYTVKKPSEADGIARVTLLRIVGTYTDPATGGLVNSDAWTRIIRPKVAIDAIDPETGGLVVDAVTETTITDDAISTPKLKANAVTAAKMAAIIMEVGKYIRSTSYVAGSSGWNVAADGSAEFNSGTFRGTVTVGVDTTFEPGYNPTTKVTTFAQATTPTAVATGDIWIDTDDNNRPYRWSGSAWVSIRDGSIPSITGLSAIIYSATAPTTRPGGSALVQGDQWIDTDDGNRPYIWSGTAWAEAYTSIKGGSIKTGAIQSTIYTPGSAGWNIDTAGTAEFQDVEVRGTLLSGTVANDGATNKSIAKGVISGVVTNGESVTFPTTYDSVPVVIFSGGATDQGASVWSPTATGADNGTGTSPRPSGLIVQSVGADVTASGFQARLRLIGKGTPTAKSASFATPTSVTAVGGTTGSATPADADVPSTDDKYTADFTVTGENTGVTTQEMNVRVALDVAKDGGAWAEVASNLIWLTIGAGATKAEPGKITATVTGIDGGNDSFRLRVKEVNNDTDTVFVSLTVTNPALSWSADSGALYANMTPNGAADAVRYFVIAEG